MISRRLFLTGIIAAPTIAAAGSLMPLRGLIMPREYLYRLNARMPWMNRLTEAQSETWLSEPMHRELQDAAVGQLIWGHQYRRIGSQLYGDIYHATAHLEAFAFSPAKGHLHQAGWGVGTVASDVLLCRAARLLPNPTSFGWQFIERLPGAEEAFQRADRSAPLP